MAAFGAALYVVSNFHVVTSQESGTGLLPRVSFSLSEAFVNIDEVMALPAVVARTRYPLTLLALEAEDQRKIDQARAISSKP